MLDAWIYLRNCQTIRSLDVILVQLMCKLEFFTILTGHPDVAAFEFESLRKLHQSGLQNSVSVESAPNLMGQDAHMYSRLFLLLHCSHLLIELCSLER